MRRLESRNILLLAGYQVVLRLAWVFKTETVMMPAFLYAISGQAWMQGWLPMLNRAGQSLPPLIYADHLRAMPRKKLSMVGTTALMGGFFLLLSLVIWIVPHRTVWWPAFFLVVYGFFFVSVGLNSLAYNTIQGKLIRAARRGRVASFGGMLGSLSAIVAAWIVLVGWQSDSVSAFILPFGVTGGGMIVAAALAWVIVEPADAKRPATEKPRQRLTEQLAESVRVVRHDRHFRRLAACAVMFICSQFLTPHYIPLAIERLPNSEVNLVVLLIVQNVGVGVFSMLFGRLADNRGNRIALRLALATCAATPVVAVALAGEWIPGGRHFYWLTFLLLGMQPVTFRVLTNYTLELTDPHAHPRYLSTLKICLAVPFLLSLPVGWLVGRLGYETVFLVGAIIIAIACAMTWRLAEPRNWPSSARSNVHPEAKR